MPTLGGNALGRLPLAGQRVRVDAAAVLPGVSAAATVGELEAYDGGVFANMVAVSAEAQVGLAKVTYGAGARMPSVLAQGLVGDLGAAGQYPALVDMPGVFATSQVGFLAVDAEINSIDAFLQGVGANAIVGTLRASTTAWDPDTPAHDGEWDEDTTLC